MCEICGKLPCDSRCPNAPEEEPIYSCERCGTGIYENETYFEAPCGPICNSCMQDMTADDVLEMLQLSYSIAAMEG